LCFGFLRGAKLLHRWPRIIGTVAFFIGISTNRLKPDSQNGAGDLVIEGVSDVQICETEEDESIWIYEKICTLLAVKEVAGIEGTISLDKMVIIARNRFVFTSLEALLKEKGIGYTLKRGERHEEPESEIGKVIDLANRAKTKKQLEEETNNVFVAVTRAKRHIYVTYTNTRKMSWGDVWQQKPSRYVEKLITP
jgi:superfamily I DNA/RNA helicase